MDLCTSKFRGLKGPGDDAKRKATIDVHNLTTTGEKTQGSSGDASEITIKEFLDFLKTAYQVQDSIEGVLMAEGMTEAVDWLKLKDSALVKPKEIACQTSESRLKEQGEKKELVRKNSDAALLYDSAEPVKKKLSEVLSEGLLDSVLPYLVPASTTSLPPRKPSQTKIVEKPSNLSTVSANSANERLGRKKSTDNSSISIKSMVIKSDSEVIIHVCDEVKGAKKDFICNQKLLVEKMGYFAEVTSGQRLDDMDISVHCDIGIFEWLMRWVKRDQLLEEDWPQLEAQCVIPVLVSAAFLQMEPLLQDCLLYCHRNMNEILRTSTNLSCLNDNVLTRLAAMYTNAEVEVIRDRKDKIQSRLYCKLIQSLCEPEPESVRGHWNSLARVFRCGKCQQLVSPSVGPDIPCHPSCMRLQPDGSVCNNHVRDSHWNINDYVERLHKSLRTWRRVYWRLWGDCHFLYCTVCQRYFPGHQFSWCRYHPDPPQFFTMDAQRASLPVGRYPCCGDRAFRFQLLECESGCQFREHTASTKNVRDTAVLSMLENYRTLIEEQPPKLVFPECLTRLVTRDENNSSDRSNSEEIFWWEGLELIPPRPKLGLLGAFCDSTVAEPPPEVPYEDEFSDYSETSSIESTTDSEKSEESCLPPSPKSHPVPQKKKPGKNRESRLWQHNLSARSNQDMQRNYEENALKQMSAVLNRRTMSASGGAVKQSRNTIWPRHITPPGGIWMRLEAEWRESVNLPPQQRLRSIYNGRMRVRPNKLT